MDDGHPPQPVQPGAIFSDDQIRKLRIIVILMSIALVVGVVTLIGRLIYLANRGSEQAPGRSNLAAEPRLTLPAGASLKATSLSGDRLLAHYIGPRGEGLIVLDLASGKTLSHVRIEPAQ